jgi:hypothetical protein
MFKCIAIAREDMEQHAATCQLAGTENGKRGDVTNVRRHAEDLPTLLCGRRGIPIYCVILMSASWKHMRLTLPLAKTN